MKLTDTEILDGLALCEAAKSALASVYTIRREHSPTTEWRLRNDRAESYLIDCADPVLALASRALAELQAARGEVAALRERRDALLLLVRQLSSSVPYEEEAGNVATLIAEVGTLRSSERALRAEVERLTAALAEVR